MGVDRVEHVEGAAFGKDNVARVSAPNRVFAGTNNPRSATPKVDNRNVESSAPPPKDPKPNAQSSPTPYVERNFLSVRRPVRLGTITVSGRDGLTVSAA